MEIINYENYLNLIPEKTKSYVLRMFENLRQISSIERGDAIFINDEELLFVISIITLYSLDEESKSKLNKLGLNNYFHFSKINRSISYIELFSKYYDIFALYENEEEYMTLLPEDIIKNIYDSKISQCQQQKYETSNMFKTDVKTFISKLYKSTDQEKEKIYLDIYQSINQNLNINMINYFDMAGRIYLYLRDNKEKIKNINTSNSDLKNISMFLSVFYFKNINKKDTVDEQKLIVDYFKSKGLTKELLEEQLGIDIKIDNLSKYKPTLILKNKFHNTISDYRSSNKQTLEKIMVAIINYSDNNSITIKNLLGLCNLTIQDVSDMQNVIEYKKQNSVNISIDDFYKGLTQNTINYLKRLCIIYNFLLSNKNNINEIIIDEDDIKTLAILLSSYELDNRLTNFFTEKNVDLDSVLKLLNLPEKQKYLEQLKEIEVDKKKVLDFYVFIKDESNKEQITPNGIISKIEESKNNKLSILKVIYTSIVNEKLDDNIKQQIDNYYEQKENKRKKELTESLLKNVSIDVYNYLQEICNCYISLQNEKMDQADHEQLSIIFAALIEDSILREYLKSIGIQSYKLRNEFNISSDYMNYPFDIDIIENHFKKYIFDRNEKDITIRSIFSNAFKKEFTNSLALRKALYNFKKTPEDFIDIDKNIAEYLKQKEEKKLQNEAINFYDTCDEQTKKIMNYVCNVHSYLENNISDLSLIETKNDIKELSVVLAILLSDTEYGKFFNRNKITIDKLLIKTNIDKKDFLNNIVPSLNNKILLEYKKYFKNYYGLFTVEMLIKSLFDDNINDSKILETITSLEGANYKYLVEEVENKRNRKLPLEEELEVLKNEPIMPIDHNNTLSLIKYGENITSHSQYLSDMYANITLSSSIEDSKKDINHILKEISCEETISKPQGFLESIFAPPKPPIVRKKYDLTKIDNLNQIIDNYINILMKELKDYIGIKTYIEIYLRKLEEQKHYLIDNYNLSLLNDNEIYQNDSEEYIGLLYKTSAIQILKDKKNLFVESQHVIKEELQSIWLLIINHIKTIDRLQLSRNEIIPLIVTEITKSFGNKNETEALLIVGSLIDLLGGLINNNNEQTEKNLLLLETTSLDEDEFKKLNEKINIQLKKEDTFKPTQKKL